MTDKKKILAKLFFSTLYLSAFTFGGGYVIVTLMKQKFVDELHWIQEDEMLDLIAIAQSAPGAIAVNGAIVVGFKLAGVLGSLRPAVVAMIASAGVLILRNAFWSGAIRLSGTNWNMVALFAAAFLLLRRTKLSPILVMLLAGAANLVISLITP